MSAGQFQPGEPMDRLNEAMERAAEALRDAMHAVHDVDPSTALPGNWYARIGQLDAITARTADLLAATAVQVGGLAWRDNLYTTDGSEAEGRVDSTNLELRKAANAARKANSHVNTAWSQIGVVGVRAPEDGTR